MYKKSENIEKLRKLIKELKTTVVNEERVNDMFESIKDACKDGYWEWKFKDNYRYFSPSLKEQLGYDLKDDNLFFEKVKVLISEEDETRVIENLEKHFKSKGKEPFRVIITYLKKNGDKIKILCRGVVTEWDENGEPLRMVGSHIDVTDIN